MIFLYRDGGKVFPNCLCGARLERYELAVREKTKRKIIVGSYFLYDILQYFNCDDLICNQSFEKSAHEISSIPFFISLSNVENVYVIAISNKNIGIDIEREKDRSRIMYERFLGISDASCIPDDVLKLNFYKKWLEKEARYKSRLKKGEMRYFRDEDLLIGVFIFPLEKITLFEVTDVSLGEASVLMKKNITIIEE